MAMKRNVAFDIFSETERGVWQAETDCSEAPPCIGKEYPRLAKNTAMTGHSPVRTAAKPLLAR